MRLLARFGSITAVLNAGPEAQTAACGDERPARLLAAARDILFASLAEEAYAGPILSEPQAVLRYLKHALANLPHECLLVLFLNSRNELIQQRLMGIGSISEAPVYPREIMREALGCGATAVILVHNHPSGDPTPSKDDIWTTKRVADAALVMDIKIHDHIIVARDGHVSLRERGFL